MRLLILNQFFYPDESATSQLMTDLAEDLVSLGLEVTVLCGRSGYTGGTASAAQETYRGIQIVRVPSTGFERRSVVRRALSYLSFYLAAFGRLLLLPRPDVLLALTTPPLIAAVACVMKLLRGTRVICLVQDLYPDVAVQLGVLRPGTLFTRFLERVSRSTLQRADAVIVLGECMRRRVKAKAVAPSRIHVLENWADGSEICSLPPESNPFRRDHGLGDQFVVLYSGNMGNAHDLDTILAAAAGLSQQPDVLFLFVGDGPKKSTVENFAVAHPDARIRLLPYASRNELSYSLSAGDASLVSLAAGLEGLVVPSKLYGILASGRPVLFVGPEGSDTARTVREAQCGFAVPNRDVTGLQQAILRLRDDRALARRMGGNARLLLEQRFERRQMTRRYYNLILSLERFSAPR